MTDWTGSGTPVTPIPSGVSTGPCLEYVSIAAVRDEFGDDVVDMTDAAIQRKIDRLSAYLEDQLGHTFGRAMVARSTSATDTVEVTAAALVIGGHTYDFATYTTLAALEAAINGAGHEFSVELLPKVNPGTPSDCLATHVATACGDGAEDRVLLCLSRMYLNLSGSGESHLFLPLPLASVTEVVENAATLAATAYWAVPGDAWLIRKLCTCNTTDCVHPRGTWSARYPGNITLEYTPQAWLGGVPSSVSAAMLEAFESLANVGPFESENFGEYSYKRGTRQVNGWRDVLGSGALRMYGMRYHP